MTSKVRYDDIRLEVADKGFILSFTELRKKTGKQSTNNWENEIRDYKKEVYVEGTKALARMIELSGKATNSSESAAVKEG